MITRACWGQWFVTSFLALALPVPARAASQEDDVWAKGTRNQFSIEFVTVGAPGNPPKTGTKYLFHPGAVPYPFRIAKYETSWEQGRKLRDASRLPVTIAPAVTGVPDEDERPCSKVIPIEVLLMANWLNTSKGYHACYNISFDGGRGVYVMDVWPEHEAWKEGGEVNLFRHKDCMYFAPSIHEYFKAAQWEPKSRTWLNYGQGFKHPPIPVNGFYGGDIRPNGAVVEQVLDERHPEWNYFEDNGNVLQVALTTKEGGITGASYKGYVSGFSRMEHGWIPNNSSNLMVAKQLDSIDFPVTQKGASGGRVQVTAYQSVSVPAEFKICAGGSGYNAADPHLTSGIGAVALGKETLTVKVWARNGVVLGLYPIGGRFSSEDTTTVLSIVQDGGNGATCQVSRYFEIRVPLTFAVVAAGQGYADGAATVKTADQPNLWQANQPWQGAAPVKMAGGFSPWGVMGLDGNVHEYSESARDGVNDMSKDERLLFFSSYWNDGWWVSGHPGEYKPVIERIWPDDSTYESGFRFASKASP